MQALSTSVCASLFLSDALGRPASSGPALWPLSPPIGLDVHLAVTGRQVLLIYSRRPVRRKVMARRRKPSLKRNDRISSKSPWWNYFDWKLTLTCRRQSKGSRPRNRDLAVSPNDQGKSLNLSELCFFLSVTWDNKMDFCVIKWDTLPWSVWRAAKCPLMSGVLFLVLSSCSLG